MSGHSLPSRIEDTNQMTDAAVNMPNPTQEVNDDEYATPTDRKLNEENQDEGGDDPI